MLLSKTHLYIVNEKNIFCMLKNIKNSNSSFPSISSEKKSPLDCNYIGGRRGDKVSCESGFPNCGLNVPKLHLHGQASQWLWVLSSDSTVTPSRSPGQPAALETKSQVTDDPHTQLWNPSVRAASHPTEETPTSRPTWRLVSAVVTGGQRTTCFLWCSAPLSHVAEVSTSVSRPQWPTRGMWRGRHACLLFTRDRTTTWHDETLQRSSHLALWDFVLLVSVHHGDRLYPQFLHFIALK